MGANSASGRTVITFARHLGAKRVVGVARNEEAMKGSGLDEMILLRENATETDLSELGHVDVVLDYSSGAPVTHMLLSLKPEGRVQYVHNGGLADVELNVLGEVLRSHDVVVRGARQGSFGMRALWAEIGGLIKSLVGAEECNFRVEKLKDEEKVWMEGGAERVVFVP